MPKPTHASVTDVPCACNYLQRNADDPRSPIMFDAETAEYQYLHKNSGFVIYHCPFCGGAAPPSKRHLLFAQIPEAEETRLAEVLRDIQTIGDALAKLGKPDFAGTSVANRSETKTDGPTTHHHRTIRYYKLSDVAEVRITERLDGKIFWQLQGKHVGRNSVNTYVVDCSPQNRPWWRFWG